MARIRSVHPRFWKSLTLARLTREERLFFIGLWNVADDQGRGVAEPRLLKGELFSLDDDVTPDVIQGWLVHLEAQNLVFLYADHDARPLYAVRSWSEHQRPERPKPSILAAPDASPSNHRRSTASSPTRSRRSRSGSGSRNGVREREKERERERTAAEAAAFEEVWKLYPKRPNNSKPKALKAWAARIHAGENPDTMLAGVQAYAAYVDRGGIQPRFIKLGATFFGPDKPYADDYGVVEGEWDGRTYNDDGTFTKGFLQTTGLKGPAT